MEYKTFIYKLQLENIKSQKTNQYAKSIPVLTYHGIVNEADGSNVLLNNFEDQMFILKKNGWSTITFEDFFEYMQGNKELPDKSFLLTFDDGQKLSYYPVDPILEALDFRAVIFVITKHSLGSGSKYYLSKKELIKMLQTNRWEIQAHAKDAHDLILIDDKGTKGHFISNKMWLSELRRIETVSEYSKRILSEFKSAKEELETALNIKVIGFAYPFGDFGQGNINNPEASQIINTLIKSVFPLYHAYQIWEGGGYTFNYPDLGDGNYLVKRISVRPNWTGEDLMKALNSGKAKSLPYIDNFVSDKGWLEISADIFIKNDTLIIKTKENSASATALLDGSYLWNNFLYTSTVNSYKSQTISLIARYSDNDNYLQCDFKPNNIKLKVIRNNIETLISESKIEIQNFEGINLGMGVSKYGVDCRVNGEIVTSGVYDVRSNHGGVGIKIWDKTPGFASIVLSGVKVESK